MPKHKRTSPAHAADDTPLSFPARPSFRNRAGRTGLDPMDTYREEGLFWGSFIKQLFTGRLRAGGVLSLALMLIAGACLLSPLLLYLFSLLNTYERPLFVIGALVVMLPFAAFGLGLVVNAALSIARLRNGGHDDMESQEGLD